MNKELNTAVSFPQKFYPPRFKSIIIHLNPAVVMVGGGKVKRARDWSGHNAYQLDGGLKGDVRRR